MTLVHTHWISPQNPSNSTAGLVHAVQVPAEVQEAQRSEHDQHASLSSNVPVGHTTTVGQVEG